MFSSNFYKEYNKEETKKRMFTNKIKNILFIFSMCSLAKMSLTHVVYKREGIFYKDTYLFYSGTELELYDALCSMSNNLERNGRGDHDELADTPLDYFCLNGNECRNDERHPNCQSNWTQFNFDSKIEMEDFLANVKPGYYPYIQISEVGPDPYA